MEKKPRIKVPSKAGKGDVIEIKTLVSHKMETGRRKDKKTGEVIPRMIINRFECKYNGKVVFAADFHPAVSANPYLSFHTRATESGTIEMSWHEDDGTVTTASADITVS